MTSSSRTRLVQGAPHQVAWTWIALLYSSGCYSGVQDRLPADSMEESDGVQDAESDASMEGSRGMPDGPSSESTDGSGADSSGDDEMTEGDESDTSQDPPPQVLACDDPDQIVAGDVRLRRLTRFEYNNTVLDLLGDDSVPANALPSEDLGNGFGNDAQRQAISPPLTEAYQKVAEDVGQRALTRPEDLVQYAPCMASFADFDDVDDPVAEESCARQFIEAFARRAYRRPPTESEVASLMDLREIVREQTSATQSLADVISAMLQSPDFLYRVEVGERDDLGHLRPTGYEMATRLSYFLWGSAPDEALLEAADQGDLSTADGVRAHAERMVADPKAAHTVRYFFDLLLPIGDLSALERSEDRYPTYSAQIGSYMREETHRLLEDVIFEQDGTWVDALNADYTYVNGPLAAYYGIEGVEGDQWERVSLDVTKRRGILTHAGLLAGPIHSNETNPVTRGSFIVQKLMCRYIPFPTDTDLLAEIAPPDPESAPTARERYAAHSEDPACAACHRLMDPVGLVFENYDAVGLWRDTENGVTIDASGELPGVGSANSAVELVELIASSEETHACLAKHWFEFAMGRTLSNSEEDRCIRSRVVESFAESGYNLQALLVNLTQTQAFLFLPEAEVAADD